MIYISSDHNGFEYKAKIIEYLKSINEEIEDLGPFVYDKDDDYPDYAFKLGEKVSSENVRGIIICGSGIGVCVACNKVNGVRAGYCESVEHAIKCKTDDNINILVLDTIIVDEELDFKIIRTWLETPFSEEERHVRRINKISEYEKGRH